MDFLHSTHFGQSQQTQRATHVNYAYRLKQFTYLVELLRLLLTKNIFIENLLHREALRGTPGGKKKETQGKIL